MAIEKVHAFYAENIAKYQKKVDTQLEEYGGLHEELLRHIRQDGLLLDGNNKLYIDALKYFEPLVKEIPKEPSQKEETIQVEIQEPKQDKKSMLSRLFGYGDK